VRPGAAAERRVGRRAGDAVTRRARRCRPRRRDDQLVVGHAAHPFFSLPPSSAPRTERSTPAFGGLGRRPPPLQALPPHLPLTRRWAVHDHAWDGRLHAGATGGRGSGSGVGGGGGGGGCGPRSGSAWASSVSRHAQLPHLDARQPLPLGLLSQPRGGGGVAAAAARRVAAVGAVTKDRRYGAQPAGVPSNARGGAPSDHARRRGRWFRPPPSMAWGPAGIGARPTRPPAAACPRPRQRVPPVDAARLSAWGWPVAAAPMVAGAAASAPPPPLVAAAAGTRRAARQPMGKGPRSGAPRAAPRTEARSV